MRSTYAVGMLALLSGLTATAGEGDLDTSFNATGKRRIQFDRGTTTATRGDHFIDLLRQPDGKVLLFGASDNDDGLVVAGLARLTEVGGLDLSFDGDGKAEVATFGALTPQAFALQPDGKIIVVGLTESAQPILMRRAADGSVANFPGSSFNALLVSFPGVDTFEFAQLLGLSDGRFLMLGRARSNSSVGSDFLVARFQAEGAIDTSFGTSPGFTRINFGLDGASADEPHALALGSDGRIAAVGEVSAGDREVGVVMLDAQGDPIMTFDGDGRAVIDFDIGQISNDRGRAACFLPDNRLVVGGTVTESINGDAVGLALLGLTGALESGFAGTGRRVYSIFARTQLGELVCTADSKFLAVGTVDASSTALAPTEAFVSRFNADGSNDSAYGAFSGTIPFGLNVAVPNGGREDTGLALALDRGGRVYAGFDAQFSGADWDYGVARLEGTLLFADGFE